MGRLTILSQNKRLWLFTQQVNDIPVELGFTKTDDNYKDLRIIWLILNCHTRLHLEFSAKLRIWQVPACKMELRSGNNFGQNWPDPADPTRAVSPPLPLKHVWTLCGDPTLVWTSDQVTTAMDGHLLSLVRWSPPIQGWLPTRKKDTIQTRNLLTYKTKTRW